MRKSRKLVGVLPVLLAFGLMACEPDNAAPDLASTYNARQCMIDSESRNYGDQMYQAENPRSTASGAYQWLNSSWSINLPWAEEYYQLQLTSPEEDLAGARYHAASASKFTQDLVTAFALKVHPQNEKPWTHWKCYKLIGTTPILRDDGPVHVPPSIIQEQIDSYYGKIRVRNARPLPAEIEAVI